MSNINETLLNTVKFDEKGLVCAIAQDWQTHRVLMVAWMKRRGPAKNRRNRVCPLLQPFPPKTMDEGRRVRAYAKST